ncbi:hypothetical protein BgiBS90_026554, partial [Biomphalaria glabrata]
MQICPRLIFSPLLSLFFRPPVFKYRPSAALSLSSYESNRARHGRNKKINIREWCGVDNGEWTGECRVARCRGTSLLCQYVGTTLTRHLRNIGIHDLLEFQKSSSSQQSALSLLTYYVLLHYFRLKEKVKKMYRA